jgi:hypothetical protein
MSAHLMSGAPTDGEYLSLKALARYSDLSVRSLRGYLVNRLHPLPHFRVGGKILVRRAEFDTWVQQFRAAVPRGVDALVDDVLAGLR